jgi:ATP-binding cassette subfamily C protein
MTSLSSRLVDALQGIKSVKAMGAEANLLQLLRQDAEDLNRSHQRLVTAAETLKLLQEPLVATLVALGLWLTLIVIRMPFADAIVLALLFYRLMGQTTTMQQHYVGVTGGESAFWSIRGEIDAAHRAREQLRGELTAPPLTESCEFDHVSFSYNGQPILRDLSLTIRAGQFVAIVGASGAGKTTLADLLLGLHIPESGQILIDSIPLSAIRIQSWRSQIGYVPQDTTLFHDTVFANVTLGDSRFDETDVQDALRSADAWSFVESRPDGIYAIVGEQGMALSGGQRQRIAIARALIRRPRLLVLDEATTALDPETEMQICQTLRKLKGDLTIVAISHQSGLQQVADSVYRLEPGRIISTSLEHATA